MVFTQSIANISTFIQISSLENGSCVYFNYMYSIFWNKNEQNINNIMLLLKQIRITVIITED